MVKGTEIENSSKRELDVIIFLPPLPPYQLKKECSEPFGEG